MAFENGFRHMEATIDLPLSPFEKKIRNHALLCSIGFLVLLPVGVLIARYTRTFTNRWLYPHWFFQLFVAGPVIWAGWAYGHQSTSDLGSGHFNEEHKKIGIALLILYVVQLVMGMVIHFVKTPSLFNGHRPPQNYFHSILGLTILALAGYQVHYGFHTEWPNITGNVHPVPQSAVNGWIALLVIFWVLYAAGLAFLPRQFRQEAESRSKNNNSASKVQETKA